MVAEPSTSEVRPEVHPEYLRPFCVLIQLLHSGAGRGVLGIGHTGLGGRQGQISGAANEREGGQVPAGAAGAASLAVAAAVLYVVALVHRRSRLNHERLAVVLPGAGFQVEGRAVEGGNFPAVEAALVAARGRRSADWWTVQKLRST